MSPMLRDIIMELATSNVALEIVADFPTRDRIADRLKAILPGLVLIGLARGETDQIARDILLAAPYSKVVACMRCAHIA
jgi:hypothetical protein